MISPRINIFIGSIGTMFASAASWAGDLPIIMPAIAAGATALWMVTQAVIAVLRYLKDK
jgi:hypothetical protein